MPVYAMPNCAFCLKVKRTFRIHNVNKIIELVWNNNLAVTLMDALQQLTVANDTSAKRMAIMKDAEISTGINASMIPIVSS